MPVGRGAGAHQSDLNTKGRWEAAVRRRNRGSAERESAGCDPTRNRSSITLSTLTITTLERSLWLVLNRQAADRYYRDRRGGKGMALISGLKIAIIPWS